MIYGIFFNSIGMVLLTIIIPSVKYIYPMEIKFVNDPSLNYYINFVLQTVGLLEAVIIFFLLVLIFIIFTMSILYELDFVAFLCSQIGKYEEKSLSLTIKKKENSIKKTTLSTDVLKEIFEDITLESKDKTSTGLKSKVLLGVIIKYHANVLQ